MVTLCKVHDTKYFRFITLQRVRNRDCKSSSPERYMRDRMSVSEDVVEHGLKVSILS